MSQVESEISNVIDMLLSLGVDEPELRVAVNDLSFYQYDDLYTDNENTRVLRMKAVLRSLWHRGGLDQFEEPLKRFRPIDDEFQTAVDRLFEATLKRRDGWYDTPEPPWNSHVVEDGGIVDREQLRRSIEQMLAEVGPKRVLLISGDGELGKSYSKQLLEVVVKRRTEKMADADLSYWDVEGGDGAGAHEVAEWLAQQLKLELPSQQYTTPVKQAQAWAGALANEIRAKMPDKTPWLFIDHVDTSSAKREEIGPFIHSLAYLAAEGRRNFRVVVVARKLDLQTALGRPAARRALEEQVKMIVDSDIESYFLNLAEYVNKHQFDGDAAHEACQEVWVRAGGHGRILDLPLCLWDVAKEKLSP
ncbi:MAG: hypothetical protein DBP02_17785 [gamma proteobacterium symbiont of Ctena orbiculata]|nr:MAG: hypothetical protein DBP02_17785 [gamma proteobacterium symbiont of Ctena orbiculata]